jgi:hypothetical protein
MIITTPDYEVLITSGPIIMNVSWMTCYHLYRRKNLHLHFNINHIFLNNIYLHQIINSRYNTGVKVLSVNASLSFMKKCDIYLILETY